MWADTRETRPACCVPRGHTPLNGHRWAGVQIKPGPVSKQHGTSEVTGRPVTRSAAKPVSPVPGGMWGWQLVTPTLARTPTGMRALRGPPPLCGRLPS